MSLEKVMSVEETKRIMTQYLEGHDLSVVAPHAVYTMMATGQVDKGRDAIAQMMDYFYTVAFDGSFEPTNLLICNEKAAIEGYLVGEHIGEFAGIPATHKQVRVPMSIFYTLSDGYIQEAHIYFQMVTLMEQLGITPMADRA